MTPKQALENILETAEAHAGVAPEAMLRTALEIARAGLAATSDPHAIAAEEAISGLMDQLQLDCAQQRDRTRKLAEYASHEDDCPHAANNFGKPCNCGLLDLLAAIDPVATGADPWQPIETAPKDGTTALVWGIALGFKEPSWFKASFRDDFDGGELYWHWGAPGYCGRVDATHWMSLPKPPSVATGAGEQREEPRHIPAISEGEYKSRIDCLSMFVRRLYRKLRKHEPDAEVISQANTYLRAIGQAGTPLRAEECAPIAPEIPSVDATGTADDQLPEGFVDAARAIVGDTSVEMLREMIAKAATGTAGEQVIVYDAEGVPDIMASLKSSLARAVEPPEIPDSGGCSKDDPK